jgi:transcription-repair coupling factor (superfamily II helicase)
VKIAELLQLNAEQEKTKNILRCLEEIVPQRLHLKGLFCSSKSLLAATLYYKKPRNYCFIFATKDEAHYFHTDLESLSDGKKVLFLDGSFKREVHPENYENTKVHQRTEVLGDISLKEGTPNLIVTYTEALAEKVISKKKLTDKTIQVKVNEEMNMDILVEQLSLWDFERTDFVYEAGQYAVRGGIVDVFSYAHDYPYRMDFNGNTIESLREFDPVTQLSEREMTWLNIVPKLDKENDIQNSTLIDYLPPDTVIFLKDGKDVKEGLSNLKDTLNEKFASVPEFISGFIGGDEIIEPLKKFHIVEIGARTLLRNHTVFEFNISPQPTFHKNFNLLIENLKYNQAKNIYNLVFSDTSKQVERLYAIFNDIDKTLKFEPIYHGISEGFIDNDLAIACYTEHQIFDRYYNYKTRQIFSKSKALTLKELRDLQPGDYVTHIDHGIGKFAGLAKMKDPSGVMQEVVKLVYRDGDLLFVGINSLHKITKYVGKEGTTPKVHKIGSDVWEKLKINTRRKVKDIARELILLYAKRKAEAGFQFSPDNYMQMELEASFMYEDTPDQSRSSEEVKRDMETPHPMDRLVCGDVGFGKTEVAMRAAFKAVCDSKQVAILVPTTILAQQHYKSFKERFKDFPVTVDYVNRFKTKSEQKVTLEKVKNGRVDILIGTHRLISKDIKFKDLGLMIIDEEQKFGVAAKEKLKERKVNVDTLTLTATPIPRTLHFSLMGARDLSVINTPPPNRQPVTTELHNFTPELIKGAINYELGRGGQVFFVHHRVKDIEEIANLIRKLCPHARVNVAHGQMDGEQLENVMIKFVEGEYDVLVATTIIESGLDISNANTIIINNAHMFGLSDTHQMRGRVGRSNKKAFCYLLVPLISAMTDDAKKRLSAIEEFSELGSGFNVAMRDLDIRGAGNLLGGEQSGFIAEIGFEMYHKILDEAIMELKLDEFSGLFVEEVAKIKETSTNCIIETDEEMLIPDYFIRNNAERLSLYSELSGLNNEEELKKFLSRLKDRFGELPPQVHTLSDSLRLKWMGKYLGLEKITVRQGVMQCYFPGNAKSDYFSSEKFSRFMTFVQSNSIRCQMKQTAKNLILVVKNVKNTVVAMNVLSEV